MRVYIRADSSSEIGSGHIMRCLTLARKLRQWGVRVVFISRDLPGHSQNLILDHGFRYHLLPGASSSSMDLDAQQTIDILKKDAASPQWLIVDHYHLDIRWERQLRPLVNRIMVIDDLANRDHDCDLLLDQNLYPDADIRYRDRVPSSCIQLVGPQFALIRREFTELRPDMPKSAQRIKRLHVAFGGADPGNETGKVLEALAQLTDRPEQIDVIVGQANPHLDKIDNLCATISGCRIYHQVDNMAQFMVQADLAVGGAGISTWERCCVGLPSLMIAIAANQHPIAQWAAEAGIGRYLGPSDGVTVNTIREEIRKVMANPEELRFWSDAGMKLVDGWGTDRVIRTMAVIAKT